MNVDDARATLTTVVLGVLIDRVDVVKALDAIGGDTIERLTKAIVESVTKSSVYADIEAHPVVEKHCDTCETCEHGYRDRDKNRRAIWWCSQGKGRNAMPFGCTAWELRTTEAT